MGLRSVLFPPRKREPPLVLDKTLKGIFRTAHVLGFGILFGGVFFGVAEASAYGPLVSLSGMLILLREVYKDGAWLCQTRGILTLLKSALLAALLAFDALGLATLTLIAVMGILASHLPRMLRKRALLRLCGAPRCGD